VRRVTMRAKDNIAPDGVRFGSNRASGLRGPRIGMNAHPAEIASKPRLHISAGLRIKRLPR